MNTAVARPIALPRALRAAISAATLRVAHEALSAARTAWAGACSISKASLMSRQGAGNTHRTRRF